MTRELAFIVIAVVVSLAGLAAVTNEFIYPILPPTEASLAAQASPTTTLILGNQVVSLGSRLAVPIQLGSTPNGVSGFDFAISVSSPTILFVEKVSFSTTEVTGQGLNRVSHVSLVNEWPASVGLTHIMDVTLFATSIGTATLTVSALSIVDGTGQSIVVSDASMTLTVVP